MNNVWRGREKQKWIFNPDLITTHNSSSHWKKKSQLIFLNWSWPKWAYLLHISLSPKCRGLAYYVFRCVCHQQTYLCRESRPIFMGHSIPHTRVPGPVGQLCSRFNLLRLLHLTICSRLAFLAQWHSPSVLSIPITVLHLALSIRHHTLELLALVLWDQPAELLFPAPFPTKRRETDTSHQYTQNNISFSTYHPGLSVASTSQPHPRCL